jgi:hypothetical protein
MKFFLNNLSSFINIWNKKGSDLFGGYGFIAFLCGVFFVYFTAASKRIDE